MERSGDVSPDRWQNNAAQHELTAQGHVESQLLQVTGAREINMQGTKPPSLWLLNHRGAERGWERVRVSFSRALLFCI